MPVVNIYAAIGAGFSDGALALTNDVLGPYFSNAPTPGTADPFAGTVMFVDPAAANTLLNIAGGAGPSPLSGFVNVVSMNCASTVNPIGRPCEIHPTAPNMVQLELDAAFE